MESVFYNISQVLGITIIHSLWQGLLVWFALRLLFACAPSLSSIKKHNAAMAAMLAISIWFAYTFVSQMHAHIWIDFSAASSPVLLPHFTFPLTTAAHAVSSSYYNYVIEGYLPYISTVYFIGLAFNLLRMGINWQKLNHIKNTMIPADRLQDYVDSLCEQLRISRYVSVNISRYVDVPCMIGFFSPIILLPISLTTYLSTEEIKAILLHELSHIKRNDYLLNMVQQFISILLFFNPFAQLINKIINQERENRCDDLVVQTTAQPLVYAHALLKLEQTRQVNLQLALAATGKKYHLLTRIERIMNTKKPIGNIRHLLVAVAIIAASISSIAWLNPTIADGKISVKKVRVTYPAVLKELLADTTHKKVAKSKKTAPAKTALRNKRIAEERYNDFNDAELNRLTAEVEKYAQKLGKYYDSPEFREQQKLMEEKGEAMEKFYNSPQLKRMQEDQEKIAEDFQKNWGETGETSKLGEKMGTMGEKIGAYYNSPEFKRMNEELRKKYGIKGDYHDDSKDENYKKYQEELQSKVSPEIKEQTEQLKKMGEKMRSHFDSPEFKKKRDEMQMMGDSLRKAFNNPEMEEQKREMKKLSEKMRAYQDNAEVKQAKARLQEASKKLREYTNSAAFKKRMADARKAAETAGEEN